MAKEKRSFFSKIFGSPNAPIERQPYTQVQIMSGYSPVFASFGNNAYSNDTVRAAIHAIATNAAKLKPKHVRRPMGGQAVPANSNLDQLLSVQPNPIMSAYDFYYKIATQLYLRNNAFIMIQRDDIGNIVGFYPVIAQTVEFVEYKDEVFLRCHFNSGRTKTLAYKDVIHLRRHFNEHDFLGENNDQALIPTLELINTTNQGIINAIKSSAYLRGLLKFTQSMLKPADMKKLRDDFVKDYLDVSNNGGVAATDAKADYVPLNNDPKMINSAQMDLIESKVYKYFGINKNIIMSDYDENQWNAFYENVIEPIAVQMSLEFTRKIFTDRERGYGNAIVFEANRLQYASNTTKLSVVQMLMPLGVLSINQALEIFNMAPIEDGDKRLISLNYVNAKEADAYQLGKDGGKGNDSQNSTE